MNIAVPALWFAPTIEWDGLAADCLISFAYATIASYCWQGRRRLLQIPRMRRYSPIAFFAFACSAILCVFHAEQATNAARPSAMAWELMFTLSSVPVLLPLATRASRILHEVTYPAVSPGELARYRALAQAVDRLQMVLELTTEGVIHKASDSYARWIGYNADEIRGLELSDLAHPDDLAGGTYDRLWKDLREGNCQAGVYRQLSKHGDPLWIEATFHPILDGNNVLVKVLGLFSNVTVRVHMERERERNEKELREGRRLLEETGSLAGVGGWQLDLETSVVTWVKETYRVLGADRSYQPTLEEALNLYPAEARPLVAQAIDHAAKTGGGWDLEVPMVRMDGRPIWARVVGRAELIDGKAVFLYGTLQDITEQKHSQDALRDQAGLLNLCHNAIIMRDMDGTIRFWNRGAEELYGLPASVATGQNLDRVLDTIFPAPVEEIERIILERKRWEGELDHRSRSGARVRVDSRWALKQDKRGRPVGIMEVNSDITDWRAAEEALRQSSEQYRLLIDAVQDYSIIMLDPLGKVTTWNQGAEKIKGYTTEEIIGRHVSVFYTKVAQAAGRPAEVLAAARTDGRCEEHDWRVRKDGSAFYANVVMTALFDSNGGLRGYCVIARDITEFQLAQEATENARIAADQANRAKSDFLANMSHEVRTPVNAIMGVTHLALHADPEARQREYLLKIDTGARQLLDIISNILDFSKMEAGKLQLEHIRFPIVEVIQNLSGTVGQKAQEKGLELIFDVAPDVPAFVQGDSLRLNQVLINLANNAVKFAETGLVLVRVTRLDEDQNSMLLRFSVTDSGIGMTPMQMENLFQSFHQADTSFTREYGGTGLGLAISKQLVELMGGAISVQSALGVGSTFAFTIRLGRADQEGAAEPSSQSLLESRDIAPAVASTPEEKKHLLTGRKVLLVEDNELNRFVAEGMLTALGVSVSIAKNGQAAVEAVQSSSFDLVLMDIQMPVMDGLTASRTIRTDERLANLPIVALTAHAMAGDYERSLAAGMNDHITKPLKPDMLERALVRWMHPKPVLVPPQAAVPSESNTSAALAQIHHDPQLLRKLLVGFAQQYANAGADLKELVLASKWAEARSLVQSLKNMAAMLETPLLADAALKIEAALDSGHPADLDPLLGSLQATLQLSLGAAATLDPPAATA